MSAADSAEPPSREKKTAIGTPYAERPVSPEGMTRGPRPTDWHT
jgi:hypothetical protein